MVMLGLASSYNCSFATMTLENKCLGLAHLKKTFPSGFLTGVATINPLE